MPRQRCSYRRQLSPLQVTVEISLGEEAFFLGLTTPIALEVVELFFEAGGPDAAKGFLNDGAEGLPFGAKATVDVFRLMEWLR